MRLRLKQVTTAGERPAEDRLNRAPPAEPTSDSSPRVRQRAFLKLIGIGAGVGIASVLAPPSVVHAQAIGDPDTYLAGQLFGPGPSSTSTLKIVSQLQSNSLAEAIQFWVYPINGTQLAKVMSIRNG